MYLATQSINRMKVERSEQTINPFGGINFVIEAISQSGIPSIIDSKLGHRAPQAEYSFSDVMLNLMSVFYCGGDCAEDLDEHLKFFLEGTPGLKVASPDTVLRVLKSLKNEREQVVSEKGNVYEISRHDTLNELNISILKHIGTLKEGESYDFDYDNEVLRTEKYDTKRTYKMVNGYFPGMATIAGTPVYFENRDGNMNVKTNQAELLERCFGMLKRQGIRINRSRMDAGSYSRSIVEVAEKYSKSFYIRANRCDFLTSTLLEDRAWERVMINHAEYEVCSLAYRPFAHAKGEEPREYRLVVMRRKKGGCQQLDLFTQDNMEYRSILTDDWQSTEKEVIEYYNQRGAEERTIDVLNNDFGWRRMPFSFMEENTVFLITMIICRNIYAWLIGRFAEVFSWLKSTFRIKKFIFRFMTVPVKWKKHGRGMVLRVFSQKPYELLQT